MNIAITLKSVCSGGGHATIGVVVDGGAEKTFRFDVDDIRGNIEDRDALILGMIRLSVAGLTRVQARNKLQTGFTVTL